MNGRLFSTHEQIVIVEAFMRNDRRPYRVLKYLPNRSLVGISRWLEQEGLYTRKRRSPAWKMRDIELLVHLWNQDVPASEIAPRVGHTAAGVYQFAESKRNREKYRLKSRKSARLYPGQIKAIAREMEMALTRSQLATGRTRGSCLRQAVEYLMREGSRKKKSRIGDLGGMVDGAVAKPQTRKKAA